MRDKWKYLQNKRWKKLEDKMDRRAKSQGCPAMTKTANAIMKKFTEGRGRELTLEKVEAKILQATNVRTSAPLSAYSLSPILTFSS